MKTTDLIKSFGALLDDFNAVSPSRVATTPTYLEITGKAKKEDVISNVLAFFFDPSQPHGLGNLFYRVFMTCAGLNGISLTEEVEVVSREFRTAKGLRIDIVIETENTVVAIENKITHWLHNDLEEYLAHIKRLDKVKSSYLAVLSIYPEQVDPAIGVNVLYDNFLIALEHQMNVESSCVSELYAPFLADFFKTLRNIKPQNMLDDQLRQYFIKNETAIQRLLEEKRKFDDEVSEKVHALLPLFEDRPHVEKLCWKNFAFNRRTFPNGLKLQVACMVDYSGYWIKIFVEQPGKDDSTKAYLEAIPYFKNVTDWFVWLDEDNAIPIDTPVADVAEIVNQISRVVFL